MSIYHLQTTFSSKIVECWKLVFELFIHFGFFSFCVFLKSSGSTFGRYTFVFISIYSSYHKREIPPELVVNFA